jgi:hypothetical protein
MDQVSRPLQVALVATLAFVALWFLALRPKEEEIPPPPKPPAQAGAQGGNSAIPGGLGNAVDKARAGQAQANQSAQQRSQQGAGSEEPSGQPPAQPAPSARTPGGAAGSTRSGAVPATPARGGRRFAASVSPAQVNAAVSSGKVVVLLFYNRRSSDDRAVRAEVGSLSRRSGRVLVGDAPLREVARYSSVTQGVQILQSPTVVVVNRRRQAQLLVGYTDRFELDQKVVNALSRR